MKIEIKDGQRKVVVTGAKSLRIVASEEHIQKMSNGSLKAYRTRVLMYHKWVNEFKFHYRIDRECNADSFLYKDNKEVYDTIYWLQKAVNREWYRRDRAAYAAWSKEKGVSGFSPRHWYKSEYAEAYKTIRAPSS